MCKGGEIMTDIENHMVIGNEVSDMDELRDRIKDREDYERLKEAADKLLSYQEIIGNPYYSELRRMKVTPKFGFGDVITLAWEYNSFEDCAKEILEIYPDSKLAKLIRHMAKVVAADALDIEI